MKLSVSMIVKNEGSCLAKCLETVKNADEYNTAKRKVWNKGLKYSDELKSRLNLKGLTLGRGWNKGKKLSEEHKRKLSESHKGIKQTKEIIIKRTAHLKGENHPLWKGINVGYYALHTWLIRNYGKGNKCEAHGCVYPRKNARGVLLKQPARYEWANITGKYDRDKINWAMMCPSCHRKFDYKNKVRYYESK